MKFWWVGAVAAIVACGTQRAVDESPSDGGSSDAGGVDGGRVDAGPQDAGRSDSGSVDAGGTWVNGTIGGQSVVGAEAVMAIDNGERPKAQVYIANVSDLCARANEPIPPQNARALQMTLAKALEGTATALPTPGTYSISQGSPTPGAMLASAAFDVITATCSFGPHTSATSGTVQVEEFGAGGCSGSFDLMFGQDHVTGRFVAPLCEMAARPDAGCRP